MTSNINLQDRIKHVFVVMLENRSFDHMLGLSNIHGIDAVSGQPTTLDGLNARNDWNLDLHGNKVYASSPADWNMLYDPGHEFNDVKEQLCGAEGNYPRINNSGFVISYSKIDPANPGEIMKCYAPDQLPVLTTLAQEFAVCDHWFSSMPGPTWPNRFFVHAASSAGLDHSPAPQTMADAILFRGYTFENGTIYNRFDKANLGWTIYKGDAFPQSLAISGMNIRALEGRFKDFKDFSGDLNNPGYTTTYAFIEPNYGHAFVGDFTCGDSQHPKDDVTRGERLLKTIYETIRNSPHWESSVLIITYDEHGGFYDHVPPPQTVAPGDATTDPANDINHFDFRQLGVRVSAVIISPFIPKGVIDSTSYDHTSVLATVESIFGLQPLTERDKHANTLNHLFSLTTPRRDAPTTLPAPSDSGFRCPGDTVASAATRLLVTDAAPATEPVPSSLQGFLHVAFLRDLQATPPDAQASRTAKFMNIQTHLEAKRYMEEVRQKVEPHEAQ
ncbi:MAG: phosphoesterase [Chloroflexi bacterium]|nr:MAG: phosphoesterase [Chloroflexota bacterium]TMC90490.1 MAG: phosphoesterase [Chloroflexota bacterium]